MKKAIFVRIPKTASESVELALGIHPKTRPRKNQQIRACTRDQNYLLPSSEQSNIRGHQSFLSQQMRKKIGMQDWNTSFKFSFVRNPYSRAVSSWKFGGWGASWNCSFSDFAKKIKNEDLINPSNWSQLTFHTCTQLSHLTEYLTDKLIVDFIGRFENLQEDFNIICDKIGIPQQELPYKNKSKHKHYTEYYDDETRQIVAEKYAKDIEYFGYEFGE